MKAFLLQLHKVVDIGFVGGASYAKHQDQLGVDRFRAFRASFVVISQTEYLFSQNGTNAYRRNTLFHQIVVSGLRE